jgi:hypothetical protein
MKATVWHRRLLIAVTTILFGVFGFCVIQERLFIRNAEQAEGRVVRLEEKPGKRQMLYYPVVEFRSGSGELIEFSSAWSSSEPTNKAGDIVKVFYDPEDPHSAQVGDWLSLWGGAAIVGALALVFAALTCGLYYRVSFNRQRRARGSR